MTNQGNRNALIIVDVQNGFCPGGELPVTDGDKVVGPLNQLIKHAKRNGWIIVRTRDWHPEDTKHFKAFGGIWPAHCVQGTKSAEFHPLLDGRDTPVFSKGMSAEEDAESYSGFGGKAEDGESLADFLDRHGVVRAFVGGLATDYCVKATALDARKHALQVVLVEDACRAVNLKPGDGNRAIAEMEDAGVELVTAEEVMDAAFV